MYTPELPEQQKILYRIITLGQRLDERLKDLRHVAITYARGPNLERGNQLLELFNETVILTELMRSLFEDMDTEAFIKASPMEAIEFFQKFMESMKRADSVFTSITEMARNVSNDPTIPTPDETPPN